MPGTGKNNERTERVYRGNKKTTGVEPLHKKTGNTDNYHDDLAKFPSENPYPVLRIHRNGTILYANKASGPLLRAKETAVGLPAPPEWSQFTEKALSSGKVLREVTTLNEHVFAFRVVPITESNYANFYGTDITEQKIAEDEREITIKLLSLINSRNQIHDLMKLVTTLLRDLSGCEAVGIRLKDGEDFPYFETNGFSDKFLQVENKLCSLNELGEPIRDSQGRVYLECMCGNIISGRFDPAKPFFTKHGSFWTNSTTALLAGTTSADRLAKTRNYCNTVGYESVALVPLRTGTETFGLLQFNSKQKNMFTQEKISLFERLADNLAIGLAHRKAEQTLRESEKRLRDIMFSMADWVWEVDENGVYTYSSEKGSDILGQSRENIVGKTPFDFMPPDEAKRVAAIFYQIATNKAPIKDLENWNIRKDGERICLLTNGVSILDKEGNLKGYRGVNKDITERKRTEEMLTLQKMLSIVILENMDAGVVACNEKGELVLFNRVARDWHRLDTLNIPQTEWADHYNLYLEDGATPMDANTVPLARAFRGETLHGIGMVIAAKGQPKRSILAHAGPIKGEDGQVLGAVVVMHDITERKWAEEKLQQANTYNRSLIEASLDPFVVIGPDGKITDVNTATETVTGYTRTVLIGTDFSDFFTEPKKAQAGYQQVFREGTVHDYPLEIKHRDGHVTPVLYNASVYRDKAGKVIGIFAAARDITERKLVQEQLQEERNLLRTLIDHIPDVVYIKDKEGRILGYNKSLAELWNVRGRDNIIGKTDFDLFEPERAQRYFDEEQKIIQTGRPVIDQEWQCTDKSGNANYLLVTKVPLRDSAGNITGLVGFHRDITEHKQAEQKILDYQKHLKRLAARLTLAEEGERRRIAGAIHDNISQTLAMAKIKLDTVLNSPPSEGTPAEIEQISSCIEKVIQETRTLTFELSNPILYELGFEAATAEWLDEQVHIKHGIATEFLNDGKAKPLDDNVKIMLFRNVRELLTNCIKHAKAETIRVNIRRIDNSIEVVVEDTGVGFDPVQVRATALKKAKFGLFSVRESLENIGGSFEIQSKPGAGCKAKMIVPMKHTQTNKEIDHAYENFIS
jgi:PAS domain S-box-containing protein